MIFAEHLYICACVYERKKKPFVDCGKWLSRATSQLIKKKTQQTTKTTSNWNNYLINKNETSHDNKFFSPATASSTFPVADAVAQFLSRKSQNVIVPEILP